jgi:hypothetical protein
MGESREVPFNMTILHGYISETRPNITGQKLNLHQRGNRKSMLVMIITFVCRSLEPVPYFSFDSNCGNHSHRCGLDFGAAVVRRIYRDRERRLWFWSWREGQRKGIDKIR